MKKYLLLLMAFVDSIASAAIVISTDFTTDTSNFAWVNNSGGNVTLPAVSAADSLTLGLTSLPGGVAFTAENVVTLRGDDSATNRRTGGGVLISDVSSVGRVSQTPPANIARFSGVFEVAEGQIFYLEWIDFEAGTASTAGATYTNPGSGTFTYDWSLTNGTVTHNLPQASITAPTTSLPPLTATPVATLALTEGVWRFTMDHQKPDNNGSMDERSAITSVAFNGTVSPVPEPAGLALGLSSLGVLVALRRRRKCA